MSTIFWDSHGIILFDYLQKEKTITGKYYASLLDRFDDWWTSPMRVRVYAPCEVMVGRVRSTPAYAVDNFGVKGGCFIFPSNQNTQASLNLVLIKKI